MRISPTIPAARRIAARAQPTTIRPSIASRVPYAGARPTQFRTFLREQPTYRATEGLNLNRMNEDSYNYHTRRRNFLLSGALAGMMAFTYTAYLLYKDLSRPAKMDSGLPDKLDPFRTDGGTKRKTVIHDENGKELVPTGHSGVPTFPRHLDLFNSAEDGQETINGVEYTLVGLGMRTVSFLGIQVYLVGFYIATQDIAAIQARLVREISPIATTLVPSEKDELRAALMDPARSEEIWSSIFRDLKPRAAFRIVPVRDTDFPHLRDAFVRAITGRTQGKAQEYGDDAFGERMKELRQVFSRGKFPKTSELLLCRDTKGTLTVTFDDAKKRAAGSDKGQSEIVGRVPEERISRLLFLNYLAGAKVASEPARKNIVDGIMEFVERPIGTVATQVV